MSELTETEIKVLFEYVAQVKSRSACSTNNMFKEMISYDFEHGKGESLELLNKHFYDIIRAENLTDHQIKRLASIISKREARWTVADSHFELDFNLIKYDGNGFVKMKNGDRIDQEPNTYKKEREHYNTIRARRLANQKTNGTEYL